MFIQNQSLNELIMDLQEDANERFPTTFPNENSKGQKFIPIGQFEEVSITKNQSKEHPRFYLATVNIKKKIMPAKQNWQGREFVEYFFGVQELGLLAKNEGNNANSYFALTLVREPKLSMEFFPFQTLYYNDTPNSEEEKTRFSGINFKGTDELTPTRVTYRPEKSHPIFGERVYDVTIMTDTSTINPALMVLSSLVRSKYDRGFDRLNPFGKNSFEVAQLVENKKYSLALNKAKELFN